MNAHAFHHAPMDACPFMPVFGPPAVMFDRGRGTELWDSDGKRYLDFLAGIAVVSLGHANPIVAESIAERGARGTAQQAGADGAVRPAADGGGVGRSPPRKRQINKRVAFSSV